MSTNKQLSLSTSGFEPPDLDRPGRQLHQGTKPKRARQIPRHSCHVVMQRRRKGWVGGAPGVRCQAPSPRLDLRSRYASISSDVATAPGNAGHARQRGARNNHNNMHRFHGNTKLCVTGPNFTGRIAAGPDGHRAERDPNQSFRTKYFIFQHSAGAFGGGGNITPQV